MIFQEPMTALDPVFTIGDQIAEIIVTHEGISHRAAMKRALELLEMVSIPSAARRLKNFPHEMSGGMRQRAMIAMALACRPSVLLADEPTTALDVTVQIQILLLLRQIQKEMGMAVVFVTHDVGVAAEISDQVAVMYAGRLVETGTVHEVLEQREPSLYRGAALLDRAWRHEGPAARHDPRPAAEPRRAAAGLLLRAALQPGGRELPSQRCARRRARPRPARALHPRAAAARRRMNPVPSACQSRSRKPYVPFR